MLKRVPANGGAGLCPETLQFFDMTIIGSFEKKSDGARQTFACVVESGFRLVHILKHFWEILVHVTILNNVSDKSAMTLVISSLTIGLAGDGSVLMIHGTSLADMIVG